MTLRVVIVGAGVGGLALAQGLHAAGVEVTVFERDTSARFRGQGYRIHIDADGGRALRRCLPERLFRLYRATSNRVSAPAVSVVDPWLHELFHQDMTGPGFDPETADTAVNRLTLRQILLADLDGTVCFGQEVTGVGHDGGGVLVRFADGSTADGDVLVAADGVGSRVRRQLLPAAEVADTGRRAVYGKTVLTHERLGWIPARFFDGFTAVIDQRGISMAAGMMRPRRPVAEAVADLAPGLAVDGFDSYLMCALVGTQDRLPGRGELFAATPDQLHELAVGMTDQWAPVLRRIVTEAETASFFPLVIRTCRGVPELPHGRVTFLGDAIHAMTPAGGVGANTALRDAAVLTERLTRVSTGADELASALAGYARAMRDYATTAVHSSLQQAGLEHLAT